MENRNKESTSSPKIIPTNNWGVKDGCKMIDLEYSQRRMFHTNGTD